MNICAIDQSLTNTGIIVFNLYTEEIIDLRVLKSIKRDKNREYTPEERIFALNEAIYRFIDEYNCEFVFLEGLSLNSNSRTMRDLAGLYYVIKSSLYGKSIPCEHIPPKSVKAFALNGNAKKEEMFEVIPQRDKEIIIDAGFKKTTGLYDLSDAYFIGKFGIKKVKDRLNLH